MPCILVVDDDEDTREAISRILIEEGFVVRTAGDGADAVRSIRTPETPSLILLDGRMPSMDGLRFLEWLEKQHEFDGINVIVMSADSTFGAGVRARAVLKKPFNIDQLIQLARKYC